MPFCPRAPLKCSYQKHALAAQTTRESPSNAFFRKCVQEHDVCDASRRVSSLKLVARVFNPQPGHTKDCTKGSHCFPALHSVLGVRIGVFDPPLISRRNTAAAHRSLKGKWVKCKEEISHPLGYGNHWDFNFQCGHHTWILSAGWIVTVP